MRSPLPYWLERFCCSLRKSNNPPVLKGHSNIFGIIKINFPLHVFSLCPPCSFYCDRSTISHYACEQAFPHGFFCCNIKYIKFGLPDISQVLNRVYPATKTGVENMEHSHKICTKSLMVENKKHVII